MAVPYVVSEAEAGQKLLAYLKRRLGVPDACAHRWIRSGQVRLNGKRCKPFDRVTAGDAVRVPPLAFAESSTPPFSPASSTSSSSTVMAASCAVPSPLPPLPPLVIEEDGLLLFNKPSGLAVQPGTGHDDSLATRLAAHYAETDFVPAPAHRLDRDTTGLLAVGATYAALRRLQDAFAGQGEKLCKEYLCWVHGACPWDAPRRLVDVLVKAGHPGAEKMQRQPLRAVRERAEAPASSAARQTGEGATARGLSASAGGERQAALRLRCLARQTVAGKVYSLLQIALETGRTHQIRVQLAGRGLPLLGDGKYGVSARVPQGAGLYLHAFRLGFAGRDHVLAPPWSAPWAVTTLPEPLGLLNAELDDVKESS